MAMQPNLPPHIIQNLSELVKSLKMRLGPNLVSLLAHGSSVRGDYNPGHSDIDLLLVLRSVSPDILSAIAPTVHSARDAGRIELMVLQEQEIQLSHDVFPLFYDEVMACHEVLAGISPFEGVRLSAAHLRLRIEQELRDANIRLRRLALDAAGDPARLGASVLHILKRSRYPLIVLLRLKGGTVPGTLLSQVIDAAAERWHVQAVPLQNPVQFPDASFAALFCLLERATRDADELLLTPSDD